MRSKLGIIFPSNFAKITLWNPKALFTIASISPITRAQNRLEFAEFPSCPSQILEKIRKLSINPVAAGRFTRCFETLHLQFWMCAPSWSNCLHFYAVFGKMWPNNKLAPLPPWPWMPLLLWEIMDPLLIFTLKTKKYHNYIAMT